jgi:hypothetical protein
MSDAETAYTLGYQPISPRFPELWGTPMLRLTISLQPLLLPTSPKVSAVLQELGHKLQKDIEDYLFAGYRSLLALLDFFLGNDIDKDDFQAANVLPPVGILLSFPVPSIRAKAVKLIDKWRIAMHLNLLDPMIAAITVKRDQHLLSNPLPSRAQPNKDVVNATSNIV